MSSEIELVSITPDKMSEVQIYEQSHYLISSCAARASMQHRIAPQGLKLHDYGSGGERPAIQSYFITLVGSVVVHPQVRMIQI